jgi:hypothetical protein
VGYFVNPDLAPGDIQSWAAALSRQRLEDFSKDDPKEIGCIPGAPHITVPRVVRIVQTPALLVVLYEDLSYRLAHHRAIPARGFRTHGTDGYV